MKRMNALGVALGVMMLLSGCAIWTSQKTEVLRPSVMYACRPCTYAPVPPETARLYFPAGRYKKMATDTEYTYYRSPSPILRFFKEEPPPTVDSHVELMGGIAVPHGSDSYGYFYMESLFSPVVDTHVEICLWTMEWGATPAELNEKDACAEPVP